MLPPSAPRVTRALALLSALAALSAPPAEASPRNRAAIAAVQKHLGVYLTTGELRDPAEKVVVQQQAIEVWFLRPVPAAERDAVVCDGARWLLTGRLDAAAGVGALFAELPEVDRVSLVFYDVLTDVERNRAGRYDQKRTPTPQARFTISRARAAQLDPKALAGTLRGARCGALAESVLDELWTKR